MEKLQELLEWAKKEQEISLRLHDAGGLVAYTFMEEKIKEMMKTTKTETNDNNNLT